MRLSKVLSVLLLVCSMLSVGWARDKFEQQRVNLTLSVDSMAVAADQVREVADQFDAQVQNLNINPENGSGNVTLRLAPDNISSAVLRLTGLGRLQNQSQSSNNFASSVEQYESRIKAFRALSQIPVDKQFDKLPAGSREFVRSEYATWVNGQITNSISNLQSYEEQSKYAEIYINFNAPQSKVAASTEGAQAPLPQDSRPPCGSGGASPQFLFLCLLNMLGLWLIYRKIDSLAALPGLRD